MRILLDNDVITNLSKDKDLLNRFIEKLVYRNHSIFISSLTIDELISGSCEISIKNRVNVIYECHSVLKPGNFKLLRGPRDIFKDELLFITSYGKKYSNFISAKRCNEIVSVLSDSSEFSVHRQTNAPELNEIRDFKKKYAELDKKFRSSTRLSSSFNIEIIESLVQNYSGLSGPNLYELVSWTMLNMDERFTQTFLRSIDVPGYSYPALKTYMRTVGFHILCMALPKQTCNPSLQVFCKSRDGDWFDIAVASSAVFADLFLSEDKGLLDRNDHLKQKKIINFESLSLSNYFQKY